MILFILFKVVIRLLLPLPQLPLLAANYCVLLMLQGLCQQLLMRVLTLCTLAHRNVHKKSRYYYYSTLEKQMLREVS